MVSNATLFPNCDFVIDRCVTFRKTKKGARAAVITTHEKNRKEGNDGIFSRVPIFSITGIVIKFFVQQHKHSHTSECPSCHVGFVFYLHVCEFDNRFYFVDLVKRSKHFER
jgi:hypothetical protein